MVYWKIARRVHRNQGAYGSVRRRSSRAWTAPGEAGTLRAWRAGGGCSPVSKGKIPSVGREDGRGGSIWLGH